MKRLLIASVVIVSLGALTIWGNRLLEQTLDAQLAPFLTKQLGLSVQLAPVKAHAIQLKATSPSLIMGDPKAPAVVAKSVEITLSWSDLLRGDVRFVYASADDLMVRPSRWPSSDSPAPDNYQFLDPWLPRTLELETGRYVSESGDDYPVNQLRWQRHTNGSATADWVEKRTAGDVNLAIVLNSLSDLLNVAPLNGELTVAAAGKKDSTVTLKAAVKPGTESAYTLQLDLEASGITAHTTATGKTAWTLPESSKTTIPLLDSTALNGVIDSYRDTSKSDDLTTLLAAAPPRLNLPAHQGHVVIDEFHIAKQTGKNTSFDFTSGEQGLQISALTSNGAAGTLTGAIGIVSNTQGWSVDVDASIEERSADSGIAPQYLGSNWLLHTGTATLKGQGDTWGTLLNSLQGNTSLAGDYHNTVNTPVTVTATLDKRPGAFALDHVAITLGTGQLTGSVELLVSEQPKLKVDLTGSKLDIGFLFDKTDAEPLPGLELPEYLNALPELELYVALSVEGLLSPALKLSQANATLERTSRGGKLVAMGKGTDTGVLNLTLEADASPNEPTDFQLTAKFNELDIPDMFQQQGIFYSRSSGSMNFTSKGDGMKDVFTAMRGAAKVSVDVRADNNWQRSARAAEKLEFTGDTQLVVTTDRILGVEIKNLDIDSIEQDLTGNISLVAGRNPWFIADMESDKLNIDHLIALLPESDEKKTDTPLQPTLQKLGAAQASLTIKSLSLLDLPLTDVEVEVVTGSDLINLQKMNFHTDNGTFNSQGKMSWKTKNGTLEATAQLSNVDLDQFLISDNSVEHIPVSGSAKLNSEGKSIEEVISNLTGYINLQGVNANQNPSPDAQRKLVFKATRVTNGMKAEISSLQWGETDLTGTLLYHETSPPLLEVDIQSGSLSLLPWENAYLGADKKTNSTAKKTSTSVASIAKSSAEFVGDALLTPLRFLAEDSKTKPGAKLFSSEPLPFSSLQDINVTVSAQLDSLLSTVVKAKHISVTGKLTAGQLTLKAGSQELNQGTGEFDLSLNANATPPSLSVTSTFEKVHGFTSEDTYPRSGYLSLKSQGMSTADLASNTSGLVFLELGKGPFDYANSVLLTANLASTVFQTLIPGISHQQPEIECGITVAVFEEGKGVTPYGFAARTNQANLLGRIHVDLGKETMQMSLDSRGRQGVGISVGSIFSNTIQIKGPLTDPGIAPDTAGLLWRGWAAVMTGGLSVLGESLIKRVLASENPCESTKELIIKDLCPNNPIAASSQMVCPTS